MDNIEMKIKNAAMKVLNKNLADVQEHSEGAYSRVYKAKCEKTGMEIVIKNYLKNGFMRQELRELDELRKHSELLVPEIYGYLDGNDELNDIFFMELMPGVPVRYIDFDNEADRERIADAVTDAHIAIHNIVNPNGFGDFDRKAHTLNWETLFRIRIDGYYKHISGLKENHMTAKARAFIDEAYHSFDRVFTEPIKEARLIHGDFKMKNVLMDPKTYKITAILDPMGCCYGDRESDLFPYINHPRDIRFGLLENYASKVRLSDNFPLKNIYYFLWNEVKLYVYMGYCMNDAYEKLGEKLHDMLKHGW